MSEQQPPQDGRSIELDIEVPGSPDDVWRAVATGPGVSSWYVPHEIEGREGGAVSLSFGPGMEVSGRVLAWDPPRRIVLGSDGPGLAFEFLVEARDGGSCVVRLINSGFGTGEDWDEQYDGMAEGWQIFLTNLRLHLTHFAGQGATSLLPMAHWAGPRDEAWQRLLAELGLPAQPAVGDHVRTGAGAPPLAGTVAAVGGHHLCLVLDDPAPGTAFLAAEGHRDQVSVSAWAYLYGGQAPELAARDEPQWRQWLAERGVEVAAQG